MQPDLEVAFAGIECRKYRHPAIRPPWLGSSQAIVGPPRPPRRALGPDIIQRCRLLTATLPFGTLDAVANGLHADPFAVLGPHEADAERRVPHARDPRLPSRRCRRWPLSDPDARPRSRWRACTRAASSRRSSQPSPRTSSTIACGDGCVTATDARRRRSLPLRSGAHRVRSTPLCRGHQRACLHRGSGARPLTHGVGRGVHFAVWAPNARRVSVVGDFNAWDGRIHPMRRAGAVRACGRSSCPVSGRAIATSSRSCRVTAGRC